ncbi:hypothetical protein KR51_00011930 [Rubidibacter lacunae KORDI 51-2]|uniref:Uncharacterized protein n=1 Tax=Rubidibacter lacunae KORDI 51-2 TaxID=582515 RepID=U5DR08_9CHRO|nr:hypothetical protein [Rubidibacter lacunae]ERN42105.1 hypothetical protein KR51_00011930 [Rubidibacter lacunae KORDI 51-2]
MSWPEFLLMTLFNAAACILLPRVITIDWARLLGQWAGSALPDADDVPTAPAE